MPAWSSEGFKAPAYRFQRIRALEVMDQEGLDPDLRAQALKGIEAISHWWGQRRPLLREILALIAPQRGRHLRLVELGAGSGHLSRWIAAELARRGFDAEVIPTDLLPSPGVQVLDCLAEVQPEADLYFSNLLLHHLGDWQACQMMLIQAKSARIGFVHFDLQRHWLHYQLAKFRTRLAGLHPINLADALLSIQQGYSKAEWGTFATATGLRLTARWRAPFRWLLTWKK
jgi:hypothetical protein